MASIGRSTLLETSPAFSEGGAKLISSKNVRRIGIIGVIAGNSHCLQPFFEFGVCIDSFCNMLFHEL